LDQDIQHFTLAVCVTPEVHCCRFGRWRGAVGHSLFTDSRGKAQRRRNLTDVREIDAYEFSARIREALEC
jgi:hypothetical protein